MAAENRASATAFYPNGNIMLFSMYTLIEPELGHARQDGLTAIGPYYGKAMYLKRTIEMAHIADLPVLCTVAPHIDFDSTTTDLSVAAAELAINVYMASKHEEISAWVLANEELRHWRPLEMESLELATQTIRGGGEWDAHKSGQTKGTRSLRSSSNQLA